MKKFSNTINKIEEWTVIVLMCALAIIVFLQVVFRYCGHSLTWSEELARYITIWATFLGASYGFRYGAHIGVEAFKSWLPFKIRRGVDFVADLAVAFLSVLMAYYGYLIIVKVHLAFGQVSPAMRMPIWIAYLAIPVGSVMMFFRNVELCIECIKDIIHGEPKQDAEAIEGGAEA